MTRKLAMSIIALGLLLTPLVYAADNPPTIKWTTVSRDCASTLDGKALYQNLCLACHGASGYGNGPAARSLTFPPTNLTRLAIGNGGEFPSRRVVHTISGTHHETVPGSQMPSWESILADTGAGKLGARLRVYNLTQYLKEIQIEEVAEVAER